MLLENISRLCKERGISIHALEKAAGLSNGTIGKWKDQNRAPRVNGVKAIADYFGVTVDSLLEGEVECETQ